MGDIYAHLAGQKSFGHYLVSPENNKTRISALDIDADQESRDRAVAGDPDVWREIIYMAEGLAFRAKRLAWEAKIPITVMLSYGGGKGLHVIIVHAEEVDAGAARGFGEGILGSFQCFHLHRGDIFWKHDDFYQDLTIEVFPKQTSVKKGQYGNLMRLPFGVNPKTGLKAFAVKPGGGLVPDDPVRALQWGSLR